MDFLKKFFPYSFGTADVTTLVVKVVIQALLAGILDILLGLLTGVPVLGVLVSILMFLISSYFTGGIVLTFLAYFKVVK